ncbi:MAG: hypothetical protein J6M39_08940, partial [Lachnospiraceae bacterium]|nr:hypothetical protein [Lachnospiraceae bacterium]
DGTITSSLDRDLDLNQNLNIHDHNYLNSLTNNQRQLINKVPSNDSFLYELTEYITDKNRPYSETLMERDGTGQLSTIYTYGNQRINSESYNNLSGLYTYDGRGSVSAVIGSYGDFRASYWYDGLGNVKSQIHGYGAFGSGKKYYGYNAEQYNPVTGNQNLRNRQLNIRRQRFLSEDTYIGTFTETLSINRYIYGNDNPLTNRDPDGLAPIYIQNQNTNNNGKEPYIIKQGDDQYFIRNGAEPVYSKNGNNYYITSGNIEVKETPKPMVGGVTSISSPKYKDNSPYSIDDVYHIQNYITSADPNLRFTQTETPIFTAKLIGGIGLGGSVSLIGELKAEAKYAIEMPLFSKEENNVVMSVGVDAFSVIGLKAKYEELDKYSIFYDKDTNGKFSLGTDLSGLGVEFSRDYLKRKTNIEYSFFDIPFASEDDIKIPIGFEIYALAGGGFKGEINISEIMRRVDKIFDRPCKK